MESDSPEDIKKATEDLAQSAHKLAEQLYAQKADGAGQPGPDMGAGAPGPDAGAQGAQGPKDDDDVVDADYTEVK